jgi:hypothetical protein
MKQTVAGMMLVQDGTPLPEAFVLETAPYTAGWSSIENSTGGRLGRGLETAGWTFFYMADEIRVIGFGFEEPSRMHRAVRKVIQTVQGQHCNCLEITQLHRKSFLGLPCVKIVAHARQIQRSRCFHDRLGPLAQLSQLNGFSDEFGSFARDNSIHCNRSLLNTAAVKTYPLSL